jgi:hypothetical protein
MLNHSSFTQAFQVCLAVALGPLGILKNLDTSEQSLHWHNSPSNPLIHTWNLSTMICKGEPYNVDADGQHCWMVAGGTQTCSQWYLVHLEATKTALLYAYAPQDHNLLHFGEDFGCSWCDALALPNNVYRKLDCGPWKQQSAHPGTKCWESDLQ